MLAGDGSPLGSPTAVMPLVPRSHGGGLVEVDVRSAAGSHEIVLPGHLFTLITGRRKRQDREREHAGTEWHKGGGGHQSRARCAAFLLAPDAGQTSTL